MSDFGFNQQVLRVAQALAFGNPEEEILRKLIAEGTPDFEALNLVAAGRVYLKLESGVPTSRLKQTFSS